MPLPWERDGRGRRDRTRRRRGIPPTSGRAGPPSSPAASPVFPPLPRSNPPFPFSPSISWVFPGIRRLYSCLAFWLSRAFLLKKGAIFGPRAFWKRRGAASEWKCAVAASCKGLARNWWMCRARFLAEAECGAVAEMLAPFAAVDTREGYTCLRQGNFVNAAFAPEMNLTFRRYIGLLYRTGSCLYFRFIPSVVLSFSVSFYFCVCVREGVLR